LANSSKQESQEISPTWRAALLFAFFFLIISAFWTLKPLRTSTVVKALGITYYPLVKQGSLLLIPFVMFVYYTMTRYLNRPQLVHFFTSIFCLGNLLFWGLFTWAPTTATKVAFFYYIDIYITVMVVLFWTYLNSVYTAGDAKKVYGTIGAGGILGGILGSGIAGWLSTTLGDSIILVSTVFLLGIYSIVNALEKGQPPTSLSVPVDTESKKNGWASYTEGIRVVWSSKYLLAIVAIVGLYEIISSVIDFQFNASTSAAFASRLDMAGYQGRVFNSAQIISLAVMVFLTPFVHKKWGMLVGLAFLPAVLFTGSIAFVLIPTLAIITFTIGAETAFAYSINQASKEILYVPLDAVAKFKAKAFIDMFVFRFAKALGGTVILMALFWMEGGSSRLLMLGNIVLIAVWLFAIVYAAKAFQKKTKEQEAAAAKQLPDHPDESDARPTGTSS